MNLFCKHCNIYLGPDADHCERCKEHPRHDSGLPQSNITWQDIIPGNIVGAPLPAEEQLICGWRNGQDGGVLGYDIQSGKRLWKIDIPCEPLQSIALNQNRIFIATQGIVRDSGGIYAYQLNGKEEPVLLWAEHQQKNANGRCDVLISGDRLYAISISGNLIWLNTTQKGKLEAQTQITCGEGRKQLGKWGPDQLIIVCECGSVSLIKPGLSGSPQVIDTKRELTGSLTVFRDFLYIGTKNNGGGLLRLDLRRKTFQTLPNGNDLTRVNVVPYKHNGMLLVSAWSHHLHALEGESGNELWRSQPACNKSLNSIPVVLHGLAFVGANDGHLHVYDLHDGRETTSWAMESGYSIVDSPATDGERLFIPAHKKDYEVSCLMTAHWSHHQYENAAQQLELEQDWEEAANYYVLASLQQDCVIHQERCKQLQQKAVDCWIQAGKPELAGAFWDALGEDERAAPCLVKAGELAQNRNQPETAALFYNQAARIYWQLGQKQEREKYQKKAARLAHWPVLRLSPFNIPRLTLKQEGPITILVENIGHSPAGNLVCKIGGSLAATATVRLKDDLELPANKHITIALHVVPTREKDDMSIRLEYHSPSHDLDFEEEMNIPLEAGPEPLIIETGMSALADIDITLSGSRPAIVKIGDMAKSQLRIRDNPTTG